MGARGWIRVAKKILLQGVRLGTGVTIHSPDPPVVDVGRQCQTAVSKKSRVQRTALGR